MSAYPPEGDPDITELRGPSVIIFGTLDESWPQLGIATKLRVMGGMAMAMWKQSRFQRQHSMPTNETFLRRALAIGKVMEQHEISLGEEGQAVMNEAIEAFPNGPRS
jgi:hypothetical protein